MERHHLDDVLGQIRRKVVRGSKVTRHGRLKGALRTIAVHHPTKPRDYGRSPLGESESNHEESSMSSLRNAISRFRSVNEAALPAPAPAGEVASGKQIPSKSRFKGDEPKPQQDYKREPVSEPADAPSMAPEFHSTAGVKGPGYDSTGRERVDVRYEQLADKLMSQDESLGQLVKMCYEMAENRTEFAGLLGKFVGADKLKSLIAATKIEADPLRVAEAIGCKKLGKMKFVAPGTGPKQEGEGQDTFHSTPKQDTEDLAFADAMLRDQVGKWGRNKIAEANTPAPAPGQKTPSGETQTPSKSNFDDRTKSHETYTRQPAPIPADAEAKEAATRSTAGVHGPGYDASAREKVDVRVEQEGNGRKGPAHAMPGEDADQAFVRINGLA